MYFHFKQLLHLYICTCQNSSHCHIDEFYTCNVYYTRSLCCVIFSYLLYAVSCSLHLKISYYRHRIQTFFCETSSLNGPLPHLRRSLLLLCPQCSPQPRHLPNIDLDERRKLSYL